MHTYGQVGNESESESAPLDMRHAMLHRGSKDIEHIRTSSKDSMT